MNLSAPSGGTIGDGQGRGTILDDDGPTINIGDLSQVEGDTGSTRLHLPGHAERGVPRDRHRRVRVSADGTATAGSRLRRYRRYADIRSRHDCARA